MALGGNHCITRADRGILDSGVWSSDLDLFAEMFILTESATNSKGLNCKTRKNKLQGYFGTLAETPVCLDSEEGRKNTL
jgi:hypothetical protein